MLAQNVDSTPEACHIEYFKDTIESFPDWWSRVRPSSVHQRVCVHILFVYLQLTIVSPESKLQSKQWKHFDSPPSKEFL
jgi:hypothetical protein